MSAEISSISNVASRVVAEVEQVIVGKSALLNHIMTAILADGHILLEDYPGLAKTLIAKSFAVALGLDFNRIQFTPDLLPSDITGSYVFDRNQSEFNLRKGPIFANMILADEINRASPKTQSALLEAMQEDQVTLEGTTMELAQPFCVIATQNPIEYEGTFPLPEAQLDRFLIKLSVGYPSVEEEKEILSRRRERRTDEAELKQVTSGDELMRMRESVEDIHVDSDIELYIAQLVAETRTEARVAVGASPRGSLALLKMARARAALDGRSYVIPDDVKIFAKAALVHRIILEPDLWMKRHAADEVIESISEHVPVPVIDAS
jgi:MoxR-like ATPase